MGVRVGGRGVVLRLLNRGVVGRKLGLSVVCGDGESIRQSRKTSFPFGNLIHGGTAVSCKWFDRMLQQIQRGVARDACGSAHDLRRGSSAQ